MLEAMYSAAVGDDVFGEDPTVIQLEVKASEMFGMEAGLFCPSGTMTNQIAIRILTEPQSEVVCDKRSHIYNYEGGGIGYNSLCSIRLVDGPRGIMSPDDVLDNVNEEDVHKPITTLVSLENTVNMGGGSCYTLTQIAEIHNTVREHGLKFHLDGARAFNALVATGEAAVNYGKFFDTISVCLSKGLGAPVGSILLGTKELINKGRRVRKVLGGGMRQSGYLAAAGVYALENNIDRLSFDHKRAKVLEETLLRLDFDDEQLDQAVSILKSLKIPQ